MSILKNWLLSVTAAALAVVLITVVVVINYLVRWLSGEDMGI